MGLFDEIEAMIMISEVTEETEETSPKSLDFPLFTLDDWDTFQCAFDDLVARGFWFKHWESIGNLLKRTLPGELYSILEAEEYR